MTRSASGNGSVRRALAPHSVRMPSCAHLNQHASQLVARTLSCAHSSQHTEQCDRQWAPHPRVWLLSQHPPEVPALCHEPRPIPIPGAPHAVQTLPSSSTAGSAGGASTAPSEGGAGLLQEAATALRRAAGVFTWLAERSLPYLRPTLPSDRWAAGRRTVQQVLMLARKGRTDHWTLGLLEHTHPCHGPHAHVGGQGPGSLQRFGTVR